MLFANGSNAWGLFVIASAKIVWVISCTGVWDLLFFKEFASETNIAFSILLVFGFLYLNTDPFTFAAFISSLCSL